jgi:hypothetical protein
MLSAREREEKDTDSVWVSRPWAVSPYRAEGFPEAPFSYFLFFSSFSFSVFLFDSYILHKCFKSNQTNFPIPQIFKTTS